MMRKVILLLASMAAAVLLATGVALATSVDEVEPNNSIEQAQNIDADKFSLDEDLTITDSTSVPHATINATPASNASATNDYYSFDVPQASVNKIGIFDMDQDPAQFQNTLWLYDSDGVEIANSSDSSSYGTGRPDPGSQVFADGYLKHEFTEAGTYYMKVSGYYDGRTFDPFIPPTTSYKLHVSIPNHPGDTTAPKVSSVTPAENATAVDRITSPTATFSEEMDTDTLTASTVQLKQLYWYQVKKKKGKKIRRVWTYAWVPVSAASVNCNDPCKTATFDPTSDLVANTYYWATVTTGAKDKAGNALAENYTWTFTTGSS